MTDAGLLELCYHPEIVATVPASILAAARESARLRASVESAWAAVAEQHRLAGEARADVARLREALANLHETACGVHPQWDSEREKQYVYEFNAARNAAQEALAATEPKETR